MKIYAVVPTNLMPDEMPVRLIRAKTSAQAVAWAVSGFYEAKVPTQDEFATLIKANTAIESAVEGEK